MLFRLTVIAATGFALAGNAAAQPYGPPPPPAYDPGPESVLATPSSPEFIRRAAQSDQFEIQSSRLAVARTRDVAVRRFAAAMIRDHGFTTQQLMRTVRRAGGLPPPPAPLRPDQQEKLAELRNAGSDFNRLYLDQQVQAHEEALALMQNYASGGDAPGLRRTAAETVPIVQHHLAMARDLRQRRY